MKQINSSTVIKSQTETIKLLKEENQQLKEKIEHLKNKAENKDKWCQFIANIGYDYDGYRQADSLMKLIDELVKYALYARDDHDFDTTMGIE